ncbi:hypothetical protein BRC71_06360 [Halobacteriales archaeon QH_7_65_31]|nr:MAG: hypothetical protein BRC71_06360 [Halobacteriales archaeon QH_7_65_31]
MDPLGLSLVEAVGGPIAVIALLALLDDLRKTRQMYTLLTGRDDVETDDGLVSQVDENTERSEENERRSEANSREIGYIKNT